MTCVRAGALLMTSHARTQSKCLHALQASTLHPHPTPPRLIGVPMLTWVTLGQQPDRSSQADGPDMGRTLIKQMECRPAGAAVFQKHPIATLRDPHPSTHPCVTHMPPLCHQKACRSKMCQLAEKAALHSREIHSLDRAAALAQPQLHRLTTSHQHLPLSPPTVGAHHASCRQLVGCTNIRCRYRGKLCTLGAWSAGSGNDCFACWGAGTWASTRTRSMSFASCCTRQQGREGHGPGVRYSCTCTL